LSGELKPPPTAPAHLGFVLRGRFPNARTRSESGSGVP